MHEIKDDKLNYLVNGQDIENKESALNNMNSHHYLDNSKFKVKKINK